MRLKIAYLSLGLIGPISAAAAAESDLTERQLLLRQMFQSDQAPAVQPPALICDKTDYTITKSGRTITINDADGLRSALRGARAGDVIVLDPGDYGWIEVRDLEFSDYVKLKGTEGAKIKHLGLTNVKKLQIEDVYFEYGSAAGQDWRPKILEMRNTHDVRIINSTFVGNTKTTTWGDDIPTIGIRAYGGSRNIVITGSKFTHIRRGVIFQQVDGYRIENNSLTDIGCDGLFFQNSSNGWIESNYLSDFRPFIYAEQGKTCHSDFIQFDAGKGRNTMTPSSNIVIRGNVMLQGEDGSSCSGIGSLCGAVQGIFLEGATGIHPETRQEHKFTNILISDNVYCASGINGLYVNNGRNISIINNAHYTCPPPFGSTHTSKIILRGTQINSTASGNTEKRVANQREALNDARTKPNLNNCLLGSL